MLKNLFVPIDVTLEQDVSFTWSDWDPYEAVGNPSPQRVQELGALSDWALVAYALACAEWVVFRFSTLLKDDRPLQFLEAAWAYEMTDEYEPPRESEESEWKGPVRGSVDLALMTTLNAIYSTKDGKPEVDAALAEQIAAHVVNDKQAFARWRDAVYQRLFKLFPRRDNAERQFVSRAVFDLSTPDGADAAGYIEKFREQLDTTENPMLRVRAESEP